MVDHQSGPGEGDAVSASVEATEGVEETQGTATISADERADPESIERYEILRRIGAGAMGIVYAARDPQLDRTIAIKLLRPERTTPRARARLQREAQAIAGLSHPGIIEVYDIGAYQGRLYIAMEFVEGRPLKELIRDQAISSWRDAVRPLIPAGRALAAAHGAGVIHGDFKPDNVLVPKSGGAKVVDFGLARALDPASELETARVEEPALTGPSVSGLSGLPGTPAYMAPELFSYERPTTRSDQFGFCVSLWEAVYGERPFAGSTIAELAFETADGKVRSPKRRAPKWLGRILRRGLQADPMARFESMNDLLAAIDRGLRRTWFGAGVAAALVSVGVLSWVGLASGEPDLCVNSEQRWIGVWDDTVRHQMVDAFRTGSRGYGQAAGSTLAATVDDYVARWNSAHHDACVALRDADSPTEESTADRRLGCLERQQREVQSLVAVLVDADADAVHAVGQIARGLPRVSRCRDPALFDAPGEAEIDAVALLRQRTDDLLASARAGRAQRVVDDARSLLSDVESVDYPPVRAEVQFAVARVLSHAGEIKTAGGLATEAYFTAQSAGYDDLAAQVAMYLMAHGSQAVSKAGGAIDWEDNAKAALQRLGRDPDRDLDYMDALARLRAAQGRYDEQYALLDRQLGLELELGQLHPRRLDLLTRRGDALMHLGRVSEALEVYRDALALGETGLGAEHPTVAWVHHGMATAFSSLGRRQAADDAYQRALGILEQAHGRAHPATARAVFNYGAELAVQGRLQEALDAYHEAHEIFGKAYGADDATSSFVLNNIGRIHELRGEYDEAVSFYQRCLRVRERTLGAEHEKVAVPLLNLATVARIQGRYDRAFELVDRAEAINVAALGPTHPDVAASMKVRGEIFLQRGNTSEAVEVLERALALSPHVLATNRAEMQYGLARGLRILAREPDRARELATAALPVLRASPEHRALADEVAAWLGADAAD